MVSQAITVVFTSFFFIVNIVYPCKRVASFHSFSSLIESFSRDMSNPYLTRTDVYRLVQMHLGQLYIPAVQIQSEVFTVPTAWSVIWTMNNLRKGGTYHFPWNYGLYEQCVLLTYRPNNPFSKVSTRIRMRGQLRLCKKFPFLNLNKRISGSRIY